MEGIGKSEREPKTGKSPRLLAESELKSARRLLAAKNGGVDTAQVQIHLQQATLYALLEIADQLGRRS